MATLMSEISRTSLFPRQAKANISKNICRISSKTGMVIKYAVAFLLIIRGSFRTDFTDLSIA